MMLMPGANRKKAVTVILSSMKPEMGDRSEGPMSYREGPESDYDLALKDAGRKVMDALEQRDVSAFVDYMKELIYMCDESMEEGEEENPMGY